MSEPIDAIHPAPLRLVRRGMRRVEDICASIRTPVTLVDADPAAFRPLRIRDGLGADSRELHEHAGRAWIMATARTDDGPHRPLRASEFRGWLVDPMPRLGLDRLFAGTPLARTILAFARHGDPDERDSWRMAVNRGVPEGFSVRTVHHDGSAAARAALRAFLADDLRIVGDRVYLRVTPMAFHRPRDPHHGCHGEIGLVAYGLLQPADLDLIARPDRTASLFGDRLDHGVPRSEIQRVAGLLPSRLLDDGDIGLLANLMPQVAVALADSLADNRGVPSEIRMETLARLEPLSAEALLVSISGIGHDGWEQALHGAQEALGVITNGCPVCTERRMADAFRDHLARRVLPRFEEQSDAEDIVALSAAAPR